MKHNKSTDRDNDRESQTVFRQDDQFLSRDGVLAFIFVC